jgi:hypothetical protein
MAGTTDLTNLLVAIGTLDRLTAVDLLTATPSLATARLERRDEFFLAERLAQVYEGDTALHVRLLSRPSAAPVPILASKTTAVRQRLTSLTGQPGAVVRAPPKPRQNNESFSNCFRSTQREGRSRLACARDPSPATLRRVKGRALLLPTTHRRRLYGSTRR